MAESMLTTSLSEYPAVSTVRISPKISPTRSARELPDNSRKYGNSCSVTNSISASPVRSRLRAHVAQRNSRRINGRYVVPSISATNSRFSSSESKTFKKRSQVSCSRYFSAFLVLSYADRKSVVKGKSVSVGVDLGVRGDIKKKKKTRKQKK